MAKEHSGPIRTNYNLAGGANPKSRQDLHNPRRGKHADDEVLAFLRWMDRQDRGSSDDILDELGKAYFRK